MAASHEPTGTAESRIKVYLCDDVLPLRQLLRAFLEQDGDVAVVGEAEDGEGLGDAVRAAGAHVVVLDLSMPHVDGLEALTALRAADAEVGVIVLSGFDGNRMAPEALALGADRYVEKAAGMQHVRVAVQAVAAERQGRLES
jgi:DNA-binding NarL/FixJ family response regulator